MSVYLVLCNVTHHLTLNLPIGIQKIGPEGLADLKIIASKATTTIHTGLIKTCLGSFALSILIIIVSAHRHQTMAPNIQKISPPTKNNQQLPNWPPCPFKYLYLMWNVSVIRFLWCQGHLQKIVRPVPHMISHGTLASHLFIVFPFRSAFSLPFFLAPFNWRGSQVVQHNIQGEVLDKAVYVALGSSSLQRVCQPFGFLQERV